MKNYTPSQCWARLVGDQTAREFMDCYDDGLPIANAVWEYLDEIRANYPYWMDGEDYDEAHKGLVRFIEAEIGDGEDDEEDDEASLEFGWGTEIG